MNIKVEILECINPLTGETIENFISIKQAAEFNGFNYQSLRNAINKNRTYKGYVWKWKTVEI